MADIRVPAINTQGTLEGAGAVAVRALTLTDFLQKRTRAIWAPTYWWADWYEKDPAKAKWARILATAGTTELVVINVSSGAGEEKSPDFATQAARARGAGCKVLGYVRTTWGDRDPETILEECKRHIEWYDVDGFFLDEYANGWPPGQVGWEKKHRPTYETLKRRYPDKLIIGNPGTNTTGEMVECADVLMTFESDAARYLGEGETPTADHEPGEFARWEYRDYPDWKFWHCIHDVKTPEQAIKVLRKASRLPVRAVYLTDDTIIDAAGERTANPYDAPPSDWLWKLQNAWAEGDTIFELFVKNFYPKFALTV